MNLLYTLGFSFMSLSCFLLLCSFLLGEKNKLNREKSTPFECGFDPQNEGRLPFSLRFFLITVIFLIFDVEIALLFPLMIAKTSAKFLIWLFLSQIFLFILLAGTFHEWNEGALTWKT